MTCGALRALLRTARRHGLLALGMGGVALSACGGGHGTAAPSTLGPSLGATSTTTSTSSAGSVPANVQQLQQATATAGLANFTATYRAVNANATVVYSQLGSQSAFSTGSSTEYTSGSTSTVCDTSGPRPTCSTGGKPLSGLLSVLDPVSASAAVRAARAQGSSVKTSIEHQDNQISSCISYTQSGSHVKFCVNYQGVVDFIKIPNATFKLVGYTSAVTPADVSVPADAIYRSS
jgi:hypothetical protein